MAARTAVVAGTAQATAVAHRQQNRYNQQQSNAEAQAAPALAPTPAPAPAPTAACADDLIAQLQQLAQLQASGVLTPEEFAAAKAKLLA